VIASDSDELEGRLPTGKANLSTSSLYYGGLRAAADLGRALGMETEAKAYDQQADAMAKAVGWKLRNERIQPVRLTGRRFRFLPVFASACAIIVVLFLGYQLQDRLLGRDNEMALVPAQDLEVIQHLDLLKEMDTIERLIQVVDLPDDLPGTEQGAPETEEGMHRDESGKSYA